MTAGARRLDSGMFEELLEVVRNLRRECPWDRKQSIATTRPLLLNEAYELDEALASGDKRHAAEELGDYLFMGLFLAVVLEKEHGTKLAGVLKRIVTKLKGRHPHVYGTTKVSGTDEVLRNWECIKQAEPGKERGKTGRSILESLPGNLPALKQAHLLQERCRRVGFDWPRAREVLDKVGEEIEEVRGELEGRRPARLAEELGDLLFALVNLCRHLGVDAESALRDANAKFSGRFRTLEQDFRRRGRRLEHATLEEMDEVWERVKRTHKPGRKRRNRRR